MSTGTVPVFSSIGTTGHTEAVNHEELAAYGHELSPELRRALTTPAPDAAIAWVEEAAETTVLSQRTLLGGTSSAIHLLTTAAAAPLDRLVLRRYVLDWVIEEADVPANEALALRLVADHTIGVPAPRLVAHDPDGHALGMPLTLMTALPGAPVWRPRDRTTWLRSLAALAVRIHATPVSAELGDWAPYPPHARTAPTWSRHPEAWLTAYALWDGPVPPSRRVFLHRDFHPGNLLWNDEQLTGVVDWVSACAGPPEEDIGHCRANLAIRLGQDWADEFLEHWQELSGTPDYHPYWDLTNVVSFDHAQVMPNLDAFVAAAAARC